MTLLLPGSVAPSRSREAVRRHSRAGLAVVILMFGGVIAWAASADLTGAVVASGFVAVESNVKKVQHPTGGVIGELLVRDGQNVEAGQVLVRLDETLTRANLQILRNQLQQLEGRRARLEAERADLRSIPFPKMLTDAAGVDTEAARVVEGERAVFETRRNSREGQKAQLRERVSQLSREIEGLTAQQEAKVKEIELIRRELQGVEELYRKNLIPITRFTLLQREETRLLGERGALMSQVAASHGKITETELQILNLDQDMRTEVARDLREAESRIAETAERLVAAEDQLRRVELRSPVAGMVNQLAVHTVGGVVQAGELLMIIVPRDEPLTVEARISPLDIEPVKKGSLATVRLSALNHRTTPELEGVVDSVSGDLIRDQATQSAYYAVRITLPPQEMAKLGDVKLIPGMPAESFIRTEPRTALSYLWKPVQDNFARALRER